ncbi:MAG: 50S ribosomal protein L4 [Candidatus Magasanikbacteria bacterium RIFOXYD1_FULL_40_23]|uniref:Large ribosomal subunit protein uL4 n=1 Tax=Candidatus Magasanikbacteria bacterium RIFOXYD1_FULL_40_23 TaxID=1798705 RepID=A0A1F6P9T1_9BACT|nr:MAG: 50S ribosomal protein L4 [Candidatus Magasanikbacteria bacterium RIFOXYD1_FULL_40_23]
MMKVKVYNLEGKETGEMNLLDSVFGVKIKPEVVHEVFVALQNNQREPWADTKSKGEVRGGGKKPWQQKGTGRARHGSIRSPIWKGGGVTFGPLSIRNYKTKINKKTKQLALKMCLSDRASSNALWVFEDFNFSEPKTKLFVKFLTALPAKAKSFLLLTPGKNDNVIRMTRNLKSVKTARVEDINVMDVLSKSVVLTNKAGAEKLEAALSKV